jgi:peroxiredoxin family protein
MEPAMAEPERLSLILLSGCFDRIHYGLAMASAAVALGRPVTLFATLAATRAFVAQGPDGRPGWAGQPLSPDLAAPELTDGGALDARNRARGIAGFEELLQACAGLGAEFIVCEMGLRAQGLTAAELREDLPIQRAGLASLLARKGQIVVL